MPVWVNVREEPVPSFPARHRVLLGTVLTEEDKVLDPFSQGFFLRTVVLDPVDLRLLNEQPGTLAGSAARMGSKGHFSYAQTQPQEFLEMLRGVLATTPPSGREPSARQEHRADEEQDE